MLTVADTAFSIAAVRAEEGELPARDRLFDDPYASAFRAAGTHAREGTQRFLELPFFREGIRLRTRFIDDFVREGLAGGLCQIVLLGAGFDTRGMRLPEIPACRAAVYEVDFADQLARKRDILDEAGVIVPPWIEYVACDLAAPDFEGALAAALEEVGLRRGDGALFVWEGVVGYIDGAVIDRSLRFMAREGGRGTRLVFTFGSTTFDPDTAVECARRAGFTACEDLGFDDVWRRYLPGEPHPHASIVRIGTAVV
jgi:methyltransferase (TIGR00027 family)